MGQTLLKKKKVFRMDFAAPEVQHVQLKNSYPSVIQPLKAPQCCPHVSIQT